MKILITGASRGIGAFLADYYLQKSFEVIAFSRSLPAQSKLDSNPNYTHFCVDITDESSVLDSLLKVRQKFGYIDCLINNAGIAAMNHLCLTPLQSAKNVMETNFFGTFLMIRECAKLLKKAPHPRIVNFSTIAVPLNLEGEAIYAASKAAVESLTKIAAKELAPYKICVNALGPTPIPTALISGVPKDKIQNLLDSQIIKQFAKMDYVANVIDFFISPKSDFITAQVLYLGGITR